MTTSSSDKKLQIRILWAFVLVLLATCGALAYQLYKATNSQDSYSALPEESFSQDTSLRMADAPTLPGGISSNNNEGISAPMLLDLLGSSDTGSIKLSEDPSRFGDGIVERVGELPIVDFQRASQPPPLPFLTRGCEGECCGILNSHTLKKEVAFRALPDAKSEILRTLPKNYELRTPAFYLKVKEYGESDVIMHDGVRRQVKGIFYLGEGNIFVWDGVKFAAMEEFRGVENGFSESWLRANDQEGASGWILLDGGPGDILELGWCR